MDITQQTLEADIVLICLKGRLDATSSRQVKALLQQLIEAKTTKLIINLEDVSFIDSSGLVALVSGLRYARENGGNITLYGVQPQARTVFRLTMLDRIFSLHPSLDDATKSLI